MHTKRLLGQVGLVLATSVASVTIAGSGVASAFNVPTNSVDSNKIVNESIRSIDVKNGTLTSADVHDNSLTGGDVADSSLTGSDVQDSSLTANDLDSGSVGSSEIVDGVIQPSDLSITAMTRWAKVNGGLTTSLLRGRGANSATRIGTGAYQVTFSQSITNCGWSATINDNDAGGASAGFATVERDASDDILSLRVKTFDANGVLTDTAEDDGFTVTVVC
jgi:hypothetical protein